MGTAMATALLALSCGHMICMQCSNRVQHCPICRQQIQDRRQLFL